MDYTASRLAQVMGNTGANGTPNMTPPPSGSSQPGGMQALPGMLSRLFDAKGKGGPKQPATPMPAGTPSFYQPMAGGDRSALLQAMMARSRMGRNPAAPVPAAATPATGY